MTTEFVSLFEICITLSSRESDRHTDRHINRQMERKREGERYASLCMCMYVTLRQIHHISVFTNIGNFDTLVTAKTNAFKQFFSLTILITGNEKKIFVYETAFHSRREPRMTTGE